MHEIPQFIPPSEAMLDEIIKFNRKSGFDHPPDIASIEQINTINNFRKFEPGRIYSIQLIGPPGTGKSKYADHLYKSGFVNLSCAPEPFGTAQKYSNRITGNERYHYGLYAYNNFQDIQILKALIAGLPLFKFPLTRRFNADEFLGQASTAGFFEYIAEQDLIQDDITTGVIVSDRSAYDLAVIWTEATYLIGNLSQKEYQKIVEARKWMKPVNSPYDATFIMLANNRDYLERKKRDDDPENTYMNTDSLAILTSVYLFHYRKLTNAEHQNVVLIDTTAPKDDVVELMDNFFEKIAGDVIKKHDLLR